MAKDKAGEIEVDKIVIENNNETPPEGYTQEEWEGLSPTEREGILESIKEPEGEEVEELSDDEEKNLEKIAGEGKTQEEIDAEAATAEQTRLEAKAKELNKTVDEVIAIEAEEKKNQGGEEEGDEVADETLLSFHPTLTAEELPEFKELEEEIPEAIQTELNTLSEKFDLGDITQREYDTQRDALNRKIVKHNIERNNTAKAEYEAQKDELLWKKEQIFFLNSKPEYMASQTTDATEKTKRNAFFGALAETVKTISKDPKNANLTGMEILVKADKVVKETFGIKPAEKKTIEKKGAKPAAKLPDHKTLADVPNAGANNDGVDDTFAQIDKLTGEAYEQALERMKPDVREAYLARV